MAWRATARSQLGFGLGKYTNRSVIDAYAGVSRGIEQWTVRASRALAPDAGAPPASGRSATRCSSRCRSVRFALDPNDVLPVSFEWTFEADRPAGARATTSSTAARRRTASTPTSSATTRSARRRLGRGRRRAAPSSTTRRWVSTRDHSWGVRYMVGRARRRRARATRCPSGVSILMIWSPLLCERADGSRYGMHLYFQRHALGGSARLEIAGRRSSIPTAAGSTFVALDARPPLRRRATAGSAAACCDRTMADGSRAAASRCTALGHRASSSAPASTSASTATGTASGAASTTSTASTSPTARRPSRPAASTSSATA